MSKTILVTGASRGIGRAIATKFLDEGYTVYGTFFQNENKIDELVKKYGSSKMKKMGPYDFRDTADINRLIEDVAGVEFDTLALIAGMFSENDDFLQFDLEEFNKVMNCNFYSQLMICLGLQNYIKQGGNITLMASNDAYSGAYGSLSYSISKSAVISLMKCLCVNFGRRGIRVNSISPGAINTDMNTPEQEFEAPLWTPIERIAEPFEVANVVYFLANDEASFINGENITIDGGYSNVSVLLKDEIQRARTIAGYDWLNSTVAKLQKGDKVYCFDTTPEYGWVHNPQEERYLNEHVAAIQRGAEIYRVIMTSDDRKQEILNNDLVKYTLANSSGAKFIGVITEEDVKKYNRKDYYKVGKGFEIFEFADGTRQLFIDSFSGEDGVGYVIENDIMTASLLEVFENVYANIQENKIKVFR